MLTMDVALLVTINAMAMGCAFVKYVCVMLAGEVLIARSLISFLLKSLLTGSQ